jgi:D-sedoheptulose 7-phosphate isomerase
MGSTQLKKKGQGSQAYIREYLAGSIMAKVAVMEQLGGPIERAGSMIAASMAKGGKWLICGNGGSAADAQHLAAEMVGRLYKLERRGLPAIALTTDSSALTCVGNDYGYAEVFARQVEALARPGDVVMGISTSGNSPNVLKALALARRMGCQTLGLSGGAGGKLAQAAGLCLTVPSQETFHIQECHITIGHLICFLVERELLARRFIKERK